MFSLDGHKALVLGGTSGIGLAAAQAFKWAGAEVTVASRSVERVAEAKALLGCQGEALDLTRDADVEAFFARNGPWRHVVVSVSAPYSGPARSMSLENAYAAMNAKFWSAYRVARVASFEPEGSLTIVSGAAGKRPSASAVLQGAINAGLEGLARGLALELAPVRVNVVSPGLIQTPLHNSISEEQRRAIYTKTAEQLPVGRIGAPQDTARAILYLACAGFATGSVVRVDGGATVA